MNIFGDGCPPPPGRLAPGVAMAQDHMYAWISFNSFYVVVGQG